MNADRLAAAALQKRASPEYYAEKLQQAEEHLQWIREGVITEGSVDDPFLRISIATVLQELNLIRADLAALAAPALGLDHPAGRGEGERDV